jgi:4-alpha-glucanotransferase
MVRFPFASCERLQFAFDGNSGNPHLPANYSTNTVVYTGTHDNDTTRGWFESLPDTDRRKVWRYLNRTEGDEREITGELLRVGRSSTAALAIAPLQDLLNFGSEARMNLPGTAEGNWRWRTTKDMLNASLFEQLKDLTASTNRLCLSQDSAVANAAQAGT